MENITAEEFLNISLGGNMNIATLKPKVFIEIMEDYHTQKNKELVKEIEERIKRNNIYIKALDKVVNKKDIHYLECENRNLKIILDKIK